MIVKSILNRNKTSFFIFFQRNFDSVIAFSQENRWNIRKRRNILKYTVCNLKSEIWIIRILFQKSLTGNGRGIFEDAISSGKNIRRLTKSCWWKSIRSHSIFATLFCKRVSFDYVSVVNWDVKRYISNEPARSFVDSSNFQIRPIQELFPVTFKLFAMH